MGEARQLAVVLIAAIIISIVGFLFGLIFINLYEGDLVISGYEAHYSFDGTLTESYLYDVKAAGTYRSLNRDWSVPVSYGRSDQTNIALITSTVPEGSFGYLKDYTREQYPL